MHGASRRHYLDHASTSPLRPSAVQAIRQWAERLGLPDGVGDPGRVHEEGRVAREAIEVAREQVAALAGVEPRRVVFTSGATEAANTAVRSAASGAGVRDLTGSAEDGGADIVCAAVEHSCVRDASAREAEAHGGRAIDAEVDRTGAIEVARLSEILADSMRTAKPALVNCQLANHEVGTLQPVDEVIAVCGEVGVPVHVDAAMGFGRVPVDAARLGATYVSVSSHKMGGPAGVGALILGRGVRLQPLLLGGSEERGRRAGSENLLGIVGFGAACADLHDHAVLEHECTEAARAAQQLTRTVEAVEGVSVVGPSDPARRLPHIVCCEVEGVLGEAVLLGLDRAGIAAHSGSACSSEALEPSPVLAAMGLDPDRSLRLSVGWSTSDDDLVSFEHAFGRVVEDLRALGAS